jgi:ArsR family transcriptional regulator, arsenate/arsenite/antimonite-responsive transcriptional repressor
MLALVGTVLSRSASGNVLLRDGDGVLGTHRLKALADPTRLRLVSLLLVSEAGELCTCDVTEPLDLSQPTISHHFKKLTEAGLVTGERRGTWTYYRIVPDALAALATVISPADSMTSSDRR